MTEILPKCSYVGDLSKHRNEIYHTAALKREDAEVSNLEPFDGHHVLLPS